MSFVSLQDALNKKISANQNLNKQIESAQIIEIAKQVLVEIFEPEIVSSIKPLFLKNRTLTLSCLSSAVAQEITLNQNQIIEKINEKIGKKEIDRLRYLL